MDNTMHGFFFSAVFRHVMISSEFICSYWQMKITLTVSQGMHSITDAELN